MKREFQLDRPEVGPSSISSLTADVGVDGTATNLHIDKMLVKFALKSKLINGRLSVEISSFFNGGFDKSNEKDAKSIDKLKEQLLNAGLTSEQAAKAILVLESNSPEYEFSPPEFIAESSKAVIGDQEVDFYPNAKTNFPLPDIGLNFNHDVNVTDVSVNDVHLNAETNIAIRDLKINQSQLDTFSVIMNSPESLSFNELSLTDARLEPVEIPSMGLPDAAISLEIPHVVINSIPLSAEINSASSEIQFNVFQDSPRWREHIGTRILGRNIGVWVEFGVNISISARYEWNISQLSVKTVINTAILNGIKASVKISKLIFDQISVGLVKFAKLLGRPI